MHTKYITIALILVIGVGVILALLVIPSSAVGIGGGTPQYTCTLTISGNYDDYLLVHYIGNFQAIFGSCHEQTLLDLVPYLSYNIAPVTLRFPFTFVDSSGANHCSNCILSYSVGWFQTSAPFSVSRTISGIPAGQYSLTINSPYPIGTIDGKSTYTASVSVP